MIAEFRQLADGVWVLPWQAAPGQVQPNVGIIQTKAGLVLVDAGNSPRHARRLLAECTRLGLGPVHSLIYTHHHWDHVFGAVLLRPEQIVAHEACYAALKQQAARTWNRNMLREDSQLNPIMRPSNEAIENLIDDWSSFRILLPHLCFRSRLNLYYDDLQIELLHVGGVHAADSILVRVPHAGVMFLGDSYYPPPYYARTDDCVDLDLAMLRACLLPGYDCFVDGHGDPRSATELHAMIEDEARRQQRS